MGNTLSSIFNKSYVQYEITEDIVFHPLVGQFLVLRDVITENFVFGIEINMNELEIQDYAELERHQLFAHANILRFEGFKKLDDENYLTLFESYEYTLEEEIQARKEQNKRFTENEVLGLLQNISAALAYFQKKGVYHGQVTAENIVKKGEDYKLIDPVIFENYETTYGKILQGEDDQVRLLSPELMKALENNDMDPEYEEYKQDVYALGVIILDAIVLDTAIPLPKKFQLAADYSKSLMQILNQMVEADPLERIDAVSCSKVIENIYYGFPMSDEAEANSVPAEVTNQVKSVLPGYYDLEISPGKEESSPQKQSASGKKSKRMPFQQLMEKMNERSSSTNSAPQEVDFSHYISLDHRAKSNPVFSIQPQSLSQSYQEQVSQDDKHGFLKTASLHKKIPEHSESYSDHISYKYTATNQSQDAVPSSFISKDTNSHNKTVASHLNTQSIDFLYTGSRSNTLHTLSQEPKKEDLNYTASDDLHQSTLKEPTETLGQVTKNAGSKALYGILGDTYASRLHARNYSNPIEHSSKKMDAAESLSRHGHEAKSITVNSRGDFISEIVSNKDATSPKAHIGSVSYHHSRQSSHQQHGSHQRSDSNIFGTQPKILVESYYLHGEGSPEQSPQKYQDIVGNIVSESASPERAQERMTTSPQKESVQLISLDNNTPASKRNFQTFRAQGGSEVPLDTVVSIPISPNQEYERLMSLYLPDRTPHNLEELARSIESLNTTSHAQAVKPFAAVLEETHHSHHPEDFHNEYLKGTETSQHLTYTASVGYPTEMSHASPGSPPQQADPAAYQSNIAYQTFNPKVWNPQLRTENLSNQSPSPKKLHEPILRNTGQTGDYVPSFNSYRAQMDFQPPGHTDTYDRYNNTLRYQDKSSLQTIIENVSTHQGLDHTDSVQLTNPNEYASNKTEQLFTTSPDNMKYRDYLTGSIDFPSKGLSTINVQTSYQATEYIPRNTVESLSPGDGFKGYLYTDYNAYGSPGQQYGESSVKTYTRDSAHPLDVGSGSKQSQIYKYSVGDLDDHYDSLGTVVNMASVDHDPQSLKEAEMTLRAMEWQKTKNALNRSRAKLRQSVIEEDDSFIDKRFEQIEMLISTVDKLSHKRVQYPPRTTERDITKLKEMARKSISISTTSFSTRHNEHGSRHRLSLFDGRTTVNGLFNTPGS